jgi:hypothetical protein
LALCGARSILPWVAYESGENVKILNRQSFLKLPEGVFFAKGIQWCVDGFCVKGATLFNEEGHAIDFFYLNLSSMDFSSCHDLADKMEDSLKNGTSYPINQCENRDGMFDDEDVFLVFEPNDLKFIRSHIESFILDCS